MKEFLQENFLLWSCSFTKVDIQANFDDSFIINVNKIDTFLSIVLVLTTKQFSLLNL